MAQIGKETLRPRVLGPREKALGISLLKDAAAVHEPDTIRNFPCETHLVGDAHHRHSVCCQGLHYGEDLANHLGVEGTGGFVEQHRRRLHGKRPSDRNPLLLTAGQLARIRAGLRCQTDTIKELQCLLSSDFPLDAIHRDWRQRDVFKRREVWEEIEALEHEADAAPEMIKVLAAHLSVHVLAIKKNGTRLDLFKPVDSSDQRRLPGARWSAHHHNFALCHVGVDVNERLKGSVVLCPSRNLRIVLSPVTAGITRSSCWVQVASGAAPVTSSTNSSSRSSRANSGRGLGGYPRRGVGVFAQQRVTQQHLQEGARSGAAGSGTASIRALIVGMSSRAVM